MRVVLCSELTKLYLYKVLWDIFQWRGPLWWLVFMELWDCVTATHSCKITVQSTLVHSREESLSAFPRAESRMKCSWSATLNMFSIYVRWLENSLTSLDKTLTVNRQIRKHQREKMQCGRGKNVWENSHLEMQEGSRWEPMLYILNANTKNAYGNWEGAQLPRYTNT